MKLTLESSGADNILNDFSREQGADEAIKKIHTLCSLHFPNIVTKIEKDDDGRLLFFTKEESDKDSLQGLEGFLRSYGIVNRDKDDDATATTFDSGASTLYSEETFDSFSSVSSDSSDSSLTTNSDYSLSEQEVKFPSDIRLWYVRNISDLDKYLTAEAKELINFYLYTFDEEYKVFDIYLDNLREGLSQLKDSQINDFVFGLKILPSMIKGNYSLHLKNWHDPQRVRFPQSAEEIETARVNRERQERQVSNVN